MLRGITIAAAARGLSLILALSLTACGADAGRRYTEGDHDRLDVADANSRNAIERLESLESRVSDLEDRLEE